MAGVLQHLRSSALDKRPNPASMVDGQIAINYASGAPGMFFKDSNGSLVKVGPVHVGSGAPNAVPASGGTAGNSIGEQWLDTSGGTYVFKIWDGAAWRSEAGEFVNATGDTMTGDLVMNNANVVFEGSVDDGFETTLTVVNPTADRTITLPNITGTVVTTGDSGTVTSTMIADGTIVNGDVNASAAIAGTKISPNFGSQTIQTTGIISAAGGSAAAPSIAFTGDTNTGIYSPGADQLAISTNGTGRLFVDASGNVGVGVSTPHGTLSVEGEGRVVTIGDSGTANRPIIKSRNSDNTGYAYLHYDAFEHRFYDSGVISYVNGQNTHVFSTSNSERARIDSSGRLLVGTSSAVAVGGVTPGTQLSSTATTNGALLSIARYGNDNGASEINLAKSRSGTNATPGGVVQSGDTLGFIRWCGDNGTDLSSVAAHIFAAVDGTPGANDMPGRLVFSTTGDGANSPTERMRIDSSGRLLVGTSSALTGTSGYNDGTLQVSNSTSGQGGAAGLAAFAWDTGTGQNDAPIVQLNKSASATRGTHAIVGNGNTLGSIVFSGSDGTNFEEAARIEAEVDGTPGTDDMPGRLVFSTTADGASSPTEALRITNDRVIAYNQAAPAAVNATTTLTVANLKTGIITSTSAAATDMTLPTGTDTEAGFSGIYTNMTFEWSVINTGPSLVRVLAGTAHTIVGSGSVATGTSGRFASRRTAANTFVTYRLS